MNAGGPFKPSRGEVDSLAGAVQSRGITVICSGLGADAAKAHGAL